LVKLPEEMAKKLPVSRGFNYAWPLAVSEDFEGRSWGVPSGWDALYRCCSKAQVASAAVIVDAKDEAANAS
jgi:hypothetical protein